MEIYLDKSDKLRVEVRELEHLMGPEDSESDVHLDAGKQQRQQHVRNLQYKWEK